MEKNKTSEGKSLKLFGVELTPSKNIEKEKEELAVNRDSFNIGGLAAGLSLKKSFSMGDLSIHNADDRGISGYVSDGHHNHDQKRRPANPARKKGVSWTEEEHKTFLKGLAELGKGDWRGISNRYVLTRTPSQVASHAQKYFIRQSAPEFKKRRSSVFDVPLKENNAALSSQESLTALRSTELPPSLTGGSSVVPQPTKHPVVGEQADYQAQVASSATMSYQTEVPQAGAATNFSFPLIPGYMRFEGATMSFVPLAPMSFPAQNMADLNGRMAKLMQPQHSVFPDQHH